MGAGGAHPRPQEGRRRRRAEVPPPRREGEGPLHDRPDQPPRRARRPSAAFEDDQGEQWLLIHKKDETSQPGWDAEDHPQSVKTGRTNDEVKADRDALWIGKAPAATAEIDLAGAEAAPLPARIDPMLATLASKPFDDPDWLFEIKWDGYRVQAVVTDGKVRIWTRNLHDAETYFPRLLSPPSWIDAREAIVDGEVVAVDDDGRPDFSLLQDAARREGRQGARLPGVRPALPRRALAARTSRSRTASGCSRASCATTRGSASRPTSKGRGRRSSRRRRRAGSRASSPSSAAPATSRAGAATRGSSSRSGPSRSSWSAAGRPGEGNARDLGALAIGVYEDGKLRFCGKVGSGFTGALRKDLLARLKPLAIDEPPFDPAPPKDYRGRWGGDLRDITWVRPELVIRAELGGWSRDGMVRQAAFKGVEAGRDPSTVAREDAVATTTAVKAAEAEAPPMPKEPSKPKTDAASKPARPSKATASKPAAHVEGGAERADRGPRRLARHRRRAQGARCAREGGRLARRGRRAEADQPRQAAVRPETRRQGRRRGARSPSASSSATSRGSRRRCCRHVQDRPLNLQRFPNGAGAPGFWQKDIPETAPKWLTRWHETGVDGRADRGANDHLIADRAAALCWLGNQASFEIHAWTGRLPDAWQPTFALIDIDPGEKTTWDETLVLARLYRTALGHLGVRGYPKVTGKRGIQVWIPIVPKYEFSETSAWVERVSRAVGATVPDLISWEWAKEARKGRARLDYTQNASIKTLVAPYAVRPAAGAPVSAPITWDELDDPDLRPDRWTIREMPERVERVGDLFAAAQTDAQELPEV